MEGLLLLVMDCGGFVDGGWGDGCVRRKLFSSFCSRRDNTLSTCLSIRTSEHKTKGSSFYGIIYDHFDWPVETIVMNYLTEI